MSHEKLGSQGAPSQIREGEAQTPEEEKFKNWKEFEKKYRDLFLKDYLPSSPDDATAKKILMEAEKHGSIKSAKLPGREEYIFIGEVEVIPGWKVRATITAKENLFPDAEELQIDDTGEFYEYHNRLRTDIDRGPYKKGIKAPENSYEFDSFDNADNYGYRWISPNPFKDSQPFSNARFGKGVGLIAPKGESLRYGILS